MHKHMMVKIGFIAVALVLGASLRSNLDASGYIVASSRSGETQCQPGGDADCSGGGQGEVL